MRSPKTVTFILLLAVVLTQSGCRAIDGLAALWGGLMLWSFVFPAVVALTVLVFNTFASGAVAVLQRARFRDAFLRSLLVTPYVLASGPVAMLVTKVLVLDLELFSTPESWPAVVELEQTAFPTLGVVSCCVGLTIGVLSALFAPWSARPPMDETPVAPEPVAPEARAPQADSPDEVG